MTTKDPPHNHSRGRSRCVRCALIAYGKMVDKSWLDALTKALWGKQ